MSLAQKNTKASMHKRYCNFIGFNSILFFVLLFIFLQSGVECGEDQMKRSEPVIKEALNFSGSLMNVLGTSKSDRQNSVFERGYSETYDNVFDSKHPFKLFLSSMKDNSTWVSKQIGVGKRMSCQLTVFVFYEGRFTIKVDSFDQSAIHLVNITLKNLNQNFSVDVIDGKIEQSVQIDSDEQKLQITEYISIAGINKKQGEQTIVFEQQRRVYLIRYAEQQWPNVSLPFRAIVITEILAFILIILLSHNIRYRRFTPLDFGFIFAVLYSLTLLLIIYIDDIVLFISPNSTVQNLEIPRYLVQVCSLVLIVIYTMDLLNFWFQSKLGIFITALIVGLFLIILDQVIFQDYWYVNDIIAVFVAGCIVKFIVIRKIKTSILPLTILWLFSIARQFVHVQSIAQEISLAIFPLHLQIPACFGDDEDGYSCSAFGSSKIIIIGLMINYSVRVDLFVSSRFYEVLMLLVAFFSLAIELMFNFIWEEIPIMEYFSIAIFLPISLILMLVFAQKRGEWAIVWHGGFYDMAVNRTSIRKSQKESITQISDNFGQGLILNGSSSYSDGSLIEK